MSAECGTQGVILHCLLRRTRSLAPRQTTNEWSSVGRKEKGERGRGRGQEARARRIEQRIGTDATDQLGFFFCDPKKLARTASELIALIVSQEKVGLGTSYSDTLRKKRGIWFSGATKLGPMTLSVLEERSTSEQHCIGVIKLGVKENNFVGIGSAK